MGESTLSVGILIRSLLYGFVLGGVSLAGSAVALPTTSGSTGAAATIVATLIVAFGTGLWAGTPQEEEPPARLSRRWIAAAALIAAAGSFSSFLATYRQLLPGPWWLFGALIVGLTLPAYALGMIPPELLLWARRNWDEDLDHGRRPLTIMLRGALVGVPAGLLLTGLVALPQLGAGPVLVACALLLLLPMTLPEPGATRAIERTLHQEVSPYGRLTVTQVDFPGERQPERRLYLNDEEESGELVRSGAPTLAYIAAAERWLSGSTPAGSRYLFLGGGAYTLPRRIAERDRRAEIVVVELDPGVTRLAYRFFGLKPAHRIRTVNGDARAFLGAGDGGTFDRIYVDVYGGSEELPHSLVTVEALQAMRGRLNPGGRVAVNLIGAVTGDDQRRLWSVITTFTEVFASIAIYLHLGREYPDRQNVLLVASQEAAGFPDTAGGFELWPRNEWPTIDGVITYHDIAPRREPPVEPEPRVEGAQQRHPLSPRERHG